MNIKESLYKILIKLSFFNIIGANVYAKLIKLKFLKPILSRLISYKIYHDMQSYNAEGNQHKSKKIDATGHSYWLSKQSLLWQLWNKEYLTVEKKIILDRMKDILHHFPENLNYFEMGCGYPSYLHSNQLKDKLKNYYGYDPNEHLAKFFSLKGVFSTLPTKEKAEVIFILGGVIKYLYEEEIEKFKEVITKLESKIILVSHPLDIKILSERINIDQINLDLINTKKIEEILKGNKTYLINFNQII